MLPTALGHNAAVAPEQYIRFLSDCSDDWGGHSAVRDGHDLVALDMTERWLDEFDEPGFFVMLTVAFGFAETRSQGGPLRDEVEIAAPDGAVKVRLTTPDNKAFTAEEGSGLRIPDVILPVRPSLLSNGQPDGSRILIEFGFRYSSIGLGEGDKVTGAKVQAFARDDRGDFMPGGYYLLGVASSSDPRNCPQSGHQGAGDPGTLYIRKDYSMRGTESPYMEVSVDTDAVAVSGAEAATIHVAVKNKFANQDQDVTVTANAPSGWKVTQKPGATPAQALQTATIPLEVQAASGTATNGTLTLSVDTSLQGHAERDIPLYWYPKGVEATIPTTAPKAEAPVPVWLVFGAMAVCGALRRRVG
jgi:hypothetical protein